MDELQCALLGSYGGAFVWNSDNTPQIHSSVRTKLHPTERTIIEQTLPLCTLYKELQTFVDDCLLLKQRNIFLVGMCAPIQHYLKEYERDVLELADIMDLHLLRQSYDPPMSCLVGILRHMIDAAHRVRGSTSPLNYLEPPSHLPRALYESLSTACTMQLVRGVAHWVAHGHTLSSDRCGFFIEHSTDDPLKANLVMNLIPKRISWDDANKILDTGKKRCLLSLFVTQEEALQAYSTIFNFRGLIHNGQLNVIELSSRVGHLKETWSQKIWRHICSSAQDPSCTFSKLLQRLRSYYMCSLGDLWLKFTHDTFDILLNFPNWISLAIEAPSFARKIHVAFSNCVSSSGYDEIFPQVHVRIQIPEAHPPQDQSNVELLAEYALVRIRSITLMSSFCSDQNVRPETSHQTVSECTYAMVIDQTAIQKYNQLFELHLRCKFVQEALHQTHRFFISLSKSRMYEMNTLRPLMQALHEMNFFMDNFVFYLQMDVQDTLYTKALESCNATINSVEGAKDLHDKLLNELLNRCYMNETSNELRDSIQNAMMLCLALYVLCRREMENEERFGYVDELVNSCKKISQKFHLQMIHIYRLLHGSTDNHALLTRMDFNHWLGSVAMRSAHYS